MEIRGKVHEVGATQQVTESFKKRDIIVAYAENPQFVEYIRFEATQDRTSIFDNLTIGEEIEISFNLRGRPWTNKEGITTYFNSLVAWRVTKLAGSSAAAPAPGYADMPAPVDISSSGDDNDDLPF
ncbi:Domain of uncharacterised function (DUF3127) [Sphingobacterium spiritivorum]|uniref:Domain of uncharacterized function (DUF3127) n=1 Tax=Sphingobacterium spiritivorum TaxID=258 RepID=A0A380BCP9_SPHSI|nr:DUF3127 domain-containing protein [Sphingobacterium spiritivorum]SUI98123.1 Domain of uncharacterised function (DUF3127) [Sphingobacterium spiritivorum]